VKGLVLLATLELAFLATSYSNLFFLLLAFSGVLGLLGAWWAVTNVRGIAVRRVDVPMAAAGSARDVELEVDTGARRRFDLTFELARECVPAKTRELLEIAHATQAASITKLAGTLAAQPRSVAPVTGLAITSHFPFGFFRARLRLPLDLELVTHPQPDDAAAAARVAAGDRDTAAARGRRGSTLAGLRPFRTGDAMADVHWKASARRGTAIVKEREPEAAPAMRVVLDRRCDAEALEHGLARIAGMVLAARHGRPLELLSQAAVFTVDPERGGAAAALRWLAGASTLPPDAEPPPRIAGAVLLPAASPKGRGDG
jgi:uncharacterized protein (DUF58 family)